MDTPDIDDASTAGSILMLQKLVSRILSDMPNKNEIAEDAKQFARDLWQQTTKNDGSFDLTDGVRIGGAAQQTLIAVLTAAGIDPIAKR